MFLFAFLTLLSLTFADDKPKGLNRVILLYTTATAPKGTDLPPVDLTTIVDPHFTRQTQLLNFYSAAQLQQFRSDAFVFYNDVWGLNFTAGTYNPLYDAYLLPNGIGLFPYTRLGSTLFPINLDSDYPERNGKWILHQVGFIAVANVFLPTDPCTIGTGLRNYTGRKNASTEFPNDLLEFSELSFSDPVLAANNTHKSPNDPKYREVIKARAIWSARQISNGEGALDTHGKLQAARANEHGKYPSYNENTHNIGYESSTVHRAVQLNGDTTYYGRASWVWTAGITAKRHLDDDMWSNPLSR